ncbi:MAG: VOC family protein [Halobacteriaceae archaeon]
MSRVVHFDIEAADPERAIEFYESVFDWAFERWDGPVEYWLVMTGPEDAPGIDGGLARREGDRPDPAAPSAAYTCTIDVADVEATVAAVTEHGGRVDREIEPVPGVGRLAYCLDTEGNRFGVMEADETAG